MNPSNWLVLNFSTKYSSCFYSILLIIWACVFVFFFPVSPPKWSLLKAILSFSSSYFPKHMALNIVGDLKYDEYMKEWNECPLGNKKLNKQIALLMRKLLIKTFSQKRKTLIAVDKCGTIQSTIISWTWK